VARSGAPLTSLEAAVPTKHVRAYRILAFLVAIGLVAAFLLGVIGMTGPGVLTPESAFLVAGVAIVVIAAALVYVLITYRHAFTRLQVQNAMIKALESDVRKAGAETQAVNRVAAADRARIAGIEPRVEHASSMAAGLGQRIQSVEDKQNRTSEAVFAVSRDVAGLREQGETVSTRQTEQSNQLMDVKQRVEGIEYTAFRASADLENQVGWVSAELAERAKDDVALATELANANNAIAKLAEQIATLETRIAKVESEEDSQDHRFAALDERLAVLDLEVATAPRLTRTLETRVTKLEQENEQREPTPAAPSFDALARLAVQAEETSRLSRDVEDVQHAVTDEKTRSIQLERRVESLESTLIARDERIARISTELAEHVKHPATVSLADLTAAPVVPIRGDDDLAAIEGIGNVFRARLREHGVRSYNELRAADAEQLAPQIGTRPKTVRAWQAMAELMQIPGIDHQVAELLVRVGIMTRETLAQTSPRSIVEKVAEYNEHHEISLHPRTLDEELAKKWIDAAQPKLVATIG
jgi:predicted flap endonuclease-1-like 5' DNA nuclease